MMLQLEVAVIVKQVEKTAVFLIFGVEDAEPVGVAGKMLDVVAIEVCGELQHQRLSALCLGRCRKEAQEAQQAKGKRKKEGQAARGGLTVVRVHYFTI